MKQKIQGSYKHYLNRIFSYSSSHFKEQKKGFQKAAQLTSENAYDKSIKQKTWCTKVENHGKNV